jgi:protein-tyrosine phosphatase
MYFRQMTKVLFVCLGNICRSPMAHGIFRDKIRKYKLDVVTDSAGTSGFHMNEPPDFRAISTLRAKGIEILDLRSRIITSEDFDEFDFIFTMDSNNQKDVLKMARNHQSAVLPEMVMNVAHPDQNISVPDPYYDDHQGFEHVYSMLDEALEILAKRFLNS